MSPNDKNTDRVGIVHDKTGQQYHVTMRAGLVIKCKKLSTFAKTIDTGRPLQLGVKAYKKALKESGQSKTVINAKVREYKQRMQQAREEAHAPYIAQTASFESLKFAEGVTVE